MVGMIRRNKPELPLALFATQDRDSFSSRFAFTNTHTLVSYCPKKRKNVLLMTTLHMDAAVSTREDKKANAILDYNRNKGGVDNLDNGYWHILLSDEDSTLADGVIFQHLRCVSLQRICGVDGGESRMEAGEIFQEEAIPGGVGESHAGTPHSTTPTPSLNASLGRNGNRDAGARRKITCCKRER
ncbi:piggyBac transposable element-derived protein 4-like protein [Lates japonicus]|uniref:PiggyBac transposable element-derived protein 4-like protein n=1 Tax=Lates japonicus TaxID=270547 RepID=A0AAD3MYE5_LATJO|nr:piggyBac transposable element-derived protein 4-like protein [Lates japonicus]